MSEEVDPRFAALCEQSVRDAKRIAELEAALREIAANAMDNATAERAERALRGKTK